MSGHARQKLGTALRRLGRFEEGLIELKKVIRFEPNYADARYNYAVLLGKNGEYVEASRELESSLKWDASLVDAREMLADLFMNSRGEGVKEGHLW